MPRIFKTTTALVAMALLAAMPAAAQQPNPLGSDLVTGKAGEHGHPVQIAMHFGDGTGGFTMNMVAVGSFSGHEVAVGDVNKDGKPDVVMVGANGPVSVALGPFMDGLQLSDFTASSAFVEGTGNCCERTRGLRLGDVNADGKLDIVVTMWTKLAVKLGNGDGTFGSPILSNATSHDTRGMDIGDLDGDGRLDLVASVAGNCCWWLAFHKGNGDGTFAPGVVLPNSGLAIPNVYVGDADADGDLDIFTGSLNGRVKIFTNNGAPNFTLTNLDPGSGLQGGPLVVDDLNGDGAADVVARTELDGFKTVRVWLSNGSGGFTTTDYSVGTFPFHGAIADVNKDGIKDVAMVVAGSGNGGIWILRGTGAGAFAAPYSVPGYRNNSTIAAANFRKPIDTTPPVITPTVTGAHSGGWYTSNVTVSWVVDDPESAFTSSGCSAETVTADTNGTTFTCSATSEGGTSSQSVTIKRDTTGPSISSVTADPSILWAPNNKMRAVTVAVSATDSGAGMAGCKITSVASSEGGSAYEPDVELTGPLTMNLRAEREGKGSGRIYTAVVTCSDAVGNTSASNTSIAVPHDQSKK